MALLVHMSDQCPDCMHFAQVLIVPGEGRVDEEGVEERICPGGGGGGP